MRSSVSSAPDGSVEHATASDSIDGGASFQFVDAPPPPIVTQISQATQPNPYTQSQQIDTQLLPPPLNTPRAAVSHFNTSIPHSSHTASTVNTDLNAILPVRHSRRIAHATAERDARLQSIRRVINDDKQRRSSLGSDVGHNVSAQSTPPSATDGDGNCDPTFEELNEKYIPPLDKEYPTPDFCHDAIQAMLVEGFGVSEPREYQIRDIFLLSFLKIRFMYLIRKCGEGKSLVSLGAAAILRGFCIVLVPLHGLGSDQVSKSKRPEAGVHAYHVDEFRDADYPQLRERLRSYTPDDDTSIICYISPQQLKPGSNWYALLMNLAQKGYISMFTVDEVHATVENHDSFRPEFKAAVDTIRTLISTSNQYHPDHVIPLLAMSATFPIEAQQCFNALVGSFPDIVDWGPMDKRNVGIYCKIDGDPVNTLLKDWAAHVTDDPDMKSLLYSNSAQACDETLIQRLEKKRDTLPKAITAGKEFVSLVGEGGLMLKTFLAAAFCAEDDFVDEYDLPNVWCMPCTSAANCGVSSKKCRKCYRYGLCPNWNDLIQEIGRVDRLLDALYGANVYCIYMNVKTFLSIWIRSQRQSNADVRRRHEKQLFQVLRFLVLPDRCYHEAIEEHFENPATYQSRGKCGNLCSFCTGAYKKFSGAISKDHLIGALIANIFDRGDNVSGDRFVGFMTDNKNMNRIKKSVWGDSTAVPSGQVHGLVLMLFAAGIIYPTLASDDLVGSKTLKPKDVKVCLKKVLMEDATGTYDAYAANDDSYWTKFQLR